MLLCTRRLEWDALHRVPGHESHCAAWHGHRYVAEIGCRADMLDAQGRIIDFGVIKSVVGGWIDAHWDHTALLMRGDPDPTAQAIADANAAHGRPAYWFSDPPTAEVIVAELARVAQALLEPYAVEIRQIRLWETPNGSATWTVE